jgi:hypothetical protein
MKNIYNLLSDAFVCARVNELDYRKNIQGNRIIITKPNSNGQAQLDLFIHDGELVEFEDSNTLFTQAEWDLFCGIIARQMPRVVQIQELMQQLYEMGQDLET